MQVIWKKHLTDSSSDHGTLGQLLSLLKRLPAAKNPKKDMNACTDALFTVFKGYILAFACKELGIENIDSDLQHPVTKSTVIEKQRFLAGLSMKIVENCTIISDTLLANTVKESGDQKYNYTRSLCHYASLALEFHDAWHEGDGNRIIRCWRMFLPHFYESGRTKYSLDALRLQIQLLTLPSHIVHQLIWDRFVNTHGGMGHNLPCDLFNEHINKALKGAIRHMGANFSQSALTNVARSITYISSVSAHFDQQCRVVDSSAHTTRDDSDDVKRVVSIVKHENLWEIHKGRKHKHPKIKAQFTITDPLHNMDRKKMKEWMLRKISEYKRYNQLQEGQLSGTESSDSN